MININPKFMIPKYVTYILQDEQDQDVFIYFCKFIDVLKLHDFVKNPAADIEQTYKIHITGYYETMREAQNAQADLVKQRGMPALLLTHFANVLGSIRCNETGQVWHRQSDCVREIGCNSSALSRHLKRMPGYATIKGMTYSRKDIYGIDLRGRENFNPQTMPKPKPRNKWIKCDTTNAVHRTQREVCEQYGVNPGQLSQHLQRHVGYKTVKGLTFSYVDATPEQAPQPQPVQYP